MEDNVRRSIRDYSEAIRLAPANARAHRARAWIRYSFVKDYKVALADYGEAIRLAPDAYEGYLARGQALAAQDDDAAALRDYDEAVRLAPTRARVWLVRGSQLSSMGEADRALADLGESIRLDPNDKFAYERRAEIWSKKADRERELADRSEVVRLVPDNAYAYMDRAYALGIGLGNDEKAIEDYTTALRLDPKRAIAHFYRARLWLSVGDTARASADFDAAVRVGHRDAYVVDQVAWWFAASEDAAQRDGARAARLARQACRLTSWRRATHLETLAAAYAEQGQFAKAVYWQEKALRAPDKSYLNRENARERLALYRAGRTCRCEPRPAQSGLAPERLTSSV